MAGGQLSRREKQVAKLVADGLTNRDIAERLVVSERTAEYHVEQIRNKLGFHSRRDIATWLHASNAARRGSIETAVPKLAQHPQTQYARRNGVNIAFQVFGSGPFDLVVVPGWVSHLEHMWQHPTYVAYLQRLGRFARLILFDKRGTGLSDRVSVGTLEDRMDDIAAVMDALGSRHAAVYGISEGAPLSLLFAATHPERVTALVVYGSFARMTEAPDYPIGRSMEAWLEQTEFTERNWPVVDLERWAPSLAHDEQFREWLGEVRRYGAGPGSARELMEVIGEIDVRAVLPAIRVPTLVLHRTGDGTIPVEMGRVVADTVPGAAWVEMPGADHLPWTGDTDALVGEIEQFLTGQRISQSADRVLAAILACDLVVSERAASTLGDAGPAEARSAFEKAAAIEVSRFGGRIARGTGSRFVATFQGPARAVRCAHALAEGASAVGVDIRSGIHTGECEIGVGTLFGTAFEIAGRVADRALPGEVLVSSTTRALMAGSGLVFKSRGILAAGDVLGEWQLHSAAERLPRHRSAASTAAPHDRNAGASKTVKERTA
jgi:pimeloyl-ACP methyl ester carboxylesterase/class 3 adenylate cyclase/DNA-binding CsgD family transcriptional regulator